MRSVRACGIFSMMIALAIGSSCAREISQRQRSVQVAAPTYDAQGRSLLQQGDLPGAERQFQLALSENSDFAPALEGLGLVALAREDPGTARRYFQQGLGLTQDYAPLHIGLGRVLSAEGRDEEALAKYQRAAEIDPTSADAYYYLGRSYVRLGDYSRAEEAFKKTLDRDPGHAGASEDWARLARQRSSPDDLPFEYMEIVKKPAVNRADMAALLAHGLPMGDICGQENTGSALDIQGHWALEEIRQVTSCELMSTDSDGNFRPRQNMSRREGARLAHRILMRHLGDVQTKENPASPGSPFPDVSDDDQDLLAIRAVVSWAIMKAQPDGSFEPEAELTGHAAMRMVRALKEKL